ncbi:MAG: response regulator [Pseudobutyrivibrio sp.]|nr:response regulator [Pseudobutyrivibrio sp.]
MGKIPVLFADDEMIVRVALNSMVDWEKTNFTVAATVSNGKEALDFLDKNSVGLVVTDLKMPEMDGIELARVLSENHFKGKVVFLTSFGEFEYARQGIKYGVSEYLLKSTITGEILLDALNKVAVDMEVSDEADCPGASFDGDEIREILKGSPVEINGDESLGRDYVIFDCYKKPDRTRESQGTPKMLASLIGEAMAGLEDTTIVPIDSMETILVMRARDAKDEKNDMRINKLRNSVRMYMNTSLFISRTDSFSNKRDMAWNIASLPSLRKYSLYAGDNLIVESMESIYIHDIKKGAGDEIRKICCLILKNDFAGAGTSLEILLDSFRGDMVNPDFVVEYLGQMQEAWQLIFGIYLEGKEEIKEEIDQAFLEAMTLEDYLLAFKRWMAVMETHPLKDTDYYLRSEIGPIMSYINSHVNEKISLGDLAAVVNFSESYISRLFKSEVGINLLTYINMRKMEGALFALLIEKASVKSVAGQMGFNDQSYFNRTFNQVYKKNPSEIQDYFAKLYK